MRIIRCIGEKLRQKIRERSGETIVETLVSMLIVVLAVTMLAGSIVAAARVNQSASKQTLYLNEEDSGNAPVTGAVVRIDGSGVSFQATGVNVMQYHPDDSAGTLYYYE